MAKISILERKCTGCGACRDACPFGAIDMASGHPEINASCRMCGVCVGVCPEKAILKLETRSTSVDKSKWKDILVFAECCGERLHPVVPELIGEALRLAENTDYAVKAVLVGYHTEQAAEELFAFGAEQVLQYDSEELGFFRADAFSDCVADAISSCRPAVVLIGGTSLGRSLAPRLSTRFHTGLTADCTRLLLRENSDLVQIRPAFGGNIMAQIVTTDTRPQFATVRYKVMNAPERHPERIGEPVRRKIPSSVLRNPVKCIRVEPVPKSTSISDAEILVAGGRGLKKEKDLDMIRELASLLGGDWATSRPLVEKGWATNDRQIGLSGRTVRPRLIITCGISGAIQFASCMKDSDHIIAINSDPEAPIFRVAHLAVVGDLYEIFPKMIERLKEGRV